MDGELESRCYVHALVMWHVRIPTAWFGKHWFGGQDGRRWEGRSKDASFFLR